MGEDSRRYAGGSSAERDDHLAAASRPAPGKQTLAQAGALAGGSSSERGGRRAEDGGEGQRAGAWLADDDLMTAMGLSEAPWCDAEEGEADSLVSRAEGSEGVGGGSGGGGGESEGASSEGTSEGAQESPKASTGGEPAASPGGQSAEYEQALSSISLPAADGAAAAPAPLSPGSTVDTSPPELAQPPSAPQAPAVFGPPDRAQRPVLGPPAPVDESAATGAGAAPPREDFLQPGWTLVNQSAIVYDEAGALLRRSPTSEAAAMPLPQNAKVHILKHNAAARWYAVVTGEGQLGYVADWLLWRHLPEESADVYRIEKGDTPLGIARDHYGPHFTRWGQDLRFVVNALVYVNQHNRHNGTGKAGLAKKGQVSESWLRAAATEDVYIWLPSADYLTSIYEEVRKHGGGTGSRTFDFFAKAASTVGAFSVFPSYVGGLAHGFLGSLGDTLGSMTELVKNLFTGEIIDELKKLYDALSKLSLADVVAALGSWAQSWGPRLTSDNHFVRGHAWGYFAGYLCAEIAMCAIGGAALEAIKTSRLATKLGQTLARTFPRLTSAVTRATSALGAGAAALREAKAKVLQRFGVALAEEIGKVRFRDLIAAAVVSGVDPAAANRLSRLLHTAGIGAKKVATWGDNAFANLASSPRTLAELEATLPLVKSGRVVGLEDWLKFGAGKVGDDAANVAAELREARRLAREFPEHKVNVGGDARAPGRPNGDKLPTFDMSVQDAKGEVVRSTELTTVDEPIHDVAHLSPVLSHAAKKAVERRAHSQPIPGELESVVRVTLAEKVAKKKAGFLQISRNGDVVQITYGVPPKTIPKGNLFDRFAEHATGYSDSQFLDVITIVDKNTGDVLSRLKREGNVWKRVQ